MRAVEIQITRGLITRVSPQDAERVRAHRWHVSQAKHTNYAATTVKGRKVYLHRFLLGATGRLQFVDHVDHDGLNNTRENIRLATPAENVANNRTRDKKLGRRGVWRTKGRFAATLRLIAGKRCDLVHNRQPSQ
jgi:hypothetical protein